MSITDGKTMAADAPMPAPTPAAPVPAHVSQTMMAEGAMPAPTAPKPAAPQGSQTMMAEGAMPPPTAPVRATPTAPTPDKPPEHKSWPPPNNDGQTVAPEEPRPAPDDDDEPPETAGSVIGSYRLVSLLGSGGMGRVWKAEHTKLGRLVALKMLKRRLAAESAAVGRFFGEARAVNAIRHEHIIDVTDFLELPEGVAYVMELLEGQSLGDARRAAPGARLPLERIVDIATQVASAMAAVHAAGIVHRDLKPDNIFLTTRSGRPDFVKLLDFGVAKLAPRDRALQTREGALIGTPEYMAPEQLLGREADQRADIYALGVILFELATGRRPFDGTTFGALVVQHTTQNVPDLLDVDPRLAALIRACLAKDRDLRPASMVDVESALRALRSAPSTLPVDALAHAPAPPARPDTLASPPAPVRRPFPFAAAAGAAVVAILAISAAIIASQADWTVAPATRPTPTATTSVPAPPVPVGQPAQPAEPVHAQPPPEPSAAAAAVEERVTTKPSATRTGARPRTSARRAATTTQPTPTTTQPTPTTTAPATTAPTTQTAPKKPADTRAVTLDPFGGG